MVGAPSTQDPKSAVRKAEEFLRCKGITSLPIDPRAIAAHLDIIVKAIPDSEPGVSGMLLRTGNIFGILYATHVPNEGFQNFSIGHELGHFLLEGHPEHFFLGGNGVHVSHAGFESKDPFEVEADYFASGLLMPDPMFTKALHHANDGLEAIETLASLCRTSLTATAIRYVQKTSTPVAVVMSTGNRINYCFMSDAMRDFPDLAWPRKGELLPSDVLTAHFNLEPRNIEESKRERGEDDLRSWFGGKRQVEIVEEVLGLGRYGKTLTVISTTVFADDEDEDAELEERWTPRFPH